MTKDAHWVWSLEQVDQANELIERLNILKRIAEMQPPTWKPNTPYDIHTDCVNTKKVLVEIQEMARKAVGK